MIVDNVVDVLKGMKNAIEVWKHTADGKLKTRVEGAGGEKGMRQEVCDGFNEEAFVIGNIERAMYASLAVSINSCVENYLKHTCRRLGITVPPKAGVPDIWGLLAPDDDFPFEPQKSEGYESADKARVCCNLFKHNEGKKDKSFVRKYDGVIDEDIEYEGEDWPTIIEDVRKLLRSLALIVEKRDPPPGEDLDL